MASIYTPGKKYDSDIPPGHPCQEHRDWHPEDQLLRRHGFRIHARPKGKPAVWTLDGVPYTHGEALAQVGYPSCEP